jgi:hypothetical protein
MWSWSSSNLLPCLRGHSQPLTIPEIVTSITACLQRTPRHIDLEISFASTRAISGLAQTCSCLIRDNPALSSALSLRTSTHRRTAMEQRTTNVVNPSLLKLQMTVWRQTSRRTTNTPLLHPGNRNALIRRCFRVTHCTGYSMPASLEREKAHAHISCGSTIHEMAHRGSWSPGNNPFHPSHSTNIEPRSYWEPQIERSCLVHAYNMLQGHHCLTPEKLQSHTRDVLEQDEMYLHTAHLEPADLCTQQGDFSLHCLNHYCITRKHKAFIGRRILSFTPLKAICDALCDHGHEGLLLTADRIGMNGHFKRLIAVNLLRSSDMTMASTMCMPHCSPRLQSSTKPSSRGYGTPMNVGLPCFCWRYHGMPHTAQHPTVYTPSLTPPALRDARGSTSSWEHDVTLFVRTFQRQTGGSGLPFAINNAVGFNLVSPQDLLHSLAEVNSDLLAPLPANPCNPDGHFAVSDFNSWASRHKLHLHLLGTEQHQPGRSWKTSLY